jgi:hypothetical protein
MLLRSQLTVLAMLCQIGVVCAQSNPVQKVFFANSPMPGTYFYSEAVYNAPSWIKNSGGRLTVCNQNFTPGNALDLTYTSSAGGAWQAAVLYRALRGIDHFEKATHLSFWLYSESGLAGDVLPEIGLAEGDQTLGHFVRLQHYLEREDGIWQNAMIPVADFGATEDQLSNVDKIIFRQQSADGHTHTLRLDQIEFVKSKADKELSAAPQLSAAQGYQKHVDITWQPVEDERVKYIKIYRAEQGGEFLPVGIQIPQISRYADFTGHAGRAYAYQISLLDHQYKESPLSNRVTAETHPMTDDELLDMVQEASFRYYWEGAEPHSGMALENIPGRKHMVATGASGFGIMAIVAGASRGFVTRAEAVERFLTITAFLKKADKFHGAFPHFLDGRTGQVVSFFGERDNGGDLVETSFLLQGLLAAQQYFDKNDEKEATIRRRIQQIWEGVEWSWYRKAPQDDYLTWHWSPDQEWVIDHQLIGWNETMITYLLAIASPTHAVPASLYYTGWASPSEHAQQYRSNWGKTSAGKDYINRNTYFGITLPVGVSTGGPLFFIHYSYLGADPRAINDAYTNYFDNNRSIAQINHRYCIENPKDYEGYSDKSWGLTASDGPWHYSANEAAEHADEGKLTPTGALASIVYTPEASMQALRHFYNEYGHFLWGAYGFRDAFNLSDNWCSEIYMGLNQAPIVVMIENHRSGLLWNLFMQNENIQQALQQIEMKD